MKSPIFWLLLILALIGGMALLGPAEKTLGTNVRVVYLHGAWVWAALAGFLAAAGTGLAGWILKRKSLHGWSRALGRAGLFFWITYIPISLWAMQTNWNGLFLAEPRFRLALIFAVTGLLLQFGLTILEDPALASAGNLVFFLVLALSLRATPNVMHPPAPILDSDVLRIQAFFAGLVLLTLLAGWQIARWWHQFETA
ncbi:MAG TPA: hypothetical protein VF498_03760 [Anaerolineales bacterium]